MCQGNVLNFLLKQSMTGNGAFRKKVLEILLQETCTKSSRMANTSLGSHLKQAKKSDPRESYRLANACIVAPLIREKHVVFERSYASAAGASEESFSIFL